MQFSSSARPATMSYPENIHEPNSNSKRLFGSISIVAGNSKGLENNISGVSNNISGNHNGDSNNNVRNSNLGQVDNIFRPDPHEEPSPPTTASMATAATATTDNTITMQKDNDKVTLTASGATAAKYKECLKNHAANMGGYAVDGCGEFMPSGEEGSLEALKCAACGCHRNFHRREMNGASSAAMGLGLLALPSPVSASNNNVEYGEGDHHSVPSGGGGHHSIMGFSPHLHHHHHHQYMPHAMSIGGKPAMVGGGGGHHQHQHHGMLNQYGGGMMGSAHHQQYQYYHGGVGGSSAGKRFRTKFTMEQREKMYEFSEKVGWRIQKQDEAAVQQFCAEVGVKRHVLKVWMHNNKNTFRKKMLRFPEAFNPTPAEPSSSQ